MNFFDLSVVFYLLFLILYFAYHVLGLKRTEIISTATRSRDVKLAMSKCYDYHINSLKFFPIWPVRLTLDLYDVVTAHYDAKV